MPRLPCSFVLLMLAACGVGTGLKSDAGVSTDANTSIADTENGDADTTVDASDAAALCSPTTPLTGFVPIGRFRFPYVALGVETAWCPSLSLVASADASRRGDFLEIRVSYEGREFSPGPARASLYVRIGDDEWNEEVMVNVTRADGLFESSVPFDEQSGSIRVSYHDATTDIEAVYEDMRYCYFPYCG